MRLLLAAAVGLPLCMLVIGSQLLWRNTWQEAVADLQRRTDIALENAARVFETHELILRDMDRLTRGVSDAEIAARQRFFHERLAELAEGLPQVRDLYIWGADGTVLASARAYPAPVANASDRSYFQAMRGGAAQPHVSQLLRGKFDKMPFFNVTWRRTGAGPGFAGLIGVSIDPLYFQRRYLQTGLADADGSTSVSLLRADGMLLARAPPPPHWPDKPLAAAAARIAAHPEGALFDHDSAVDGISRHIELRRVGRLPMYVATTFSSASVLHVFLATMTPHLYFGVPATIMLIAVVLLVRRRTREVERATIHAEAETVRRIAAERAAQTAGRMEALGKVAGGVAHDFNNLLSVILGNAETASRRQAQPAMRELERITAAAKRGALLTARLLAFSRRRPAEATVIDLRVRLPQIVEAIRPALRGDIELRLDVAGAPWPVEADDVELELALLNLATNARDAMPRGGQLRINVANRSIVAGALSAAPDLAGDFVVIQVADSGCGMPAEVASRAFEPFFTTKEVGRGTGLGLSQVYGFARQSGGTALLDSRPDHGTTVTLLLPRAASGIAAAPVTAAAGEAGPRDPALRRILLVDDNAEVAEAMATLLRGMDCQVEIVGDAASALRRLEGGPLPDLLISDVVMPGPLKGDELVRLVRRRYPGLRTALATGYADRPLAREPGVPLLNKPVSSADLARLLAMPAAQPAA